MPPDLAIIIPVLDDADALEALLSSLRDHCPSTLQLQIIVVDGGSSDCSFAVAEAGADLVLASAPGRACQLQFGVARAQAPLIWLLHADSGVDVRHLDDLAALQGRADVWGRFDVRLDANTLWARCIAWFMNHRSCLTGICTGDQGIFVASALLHSVGGIPQQALMEDIELSRRLKRRCRPLCLTTPLGTSARRWQRHGVLRTVLLMWWLRLRYLLGADPRDLHRAYYGR
jgi:rSAM/selenodomain-associated transferase 2